MKILFFTIIGLLFSSNSFSQQIQLDSLDSQIKQLLKDFDIPGLSIGVVRNDSVLFSKGYGNLEINKKRKVDENTIFGIGSISKSFTVLTLGILVDEGKINWDDKVIKYLKDFKLYNDYVTKNFTIRDLLTHRSGLKQVSGGVLWYHSDYSREQIMARLKYLEPVSGFREKAAYQNVTYLIASEIVKKVSGMSWDKFLKNRIFDKIGMNNSTSISSEREANSNLAQPHIWNENYEKVTIKQEKGDNISPAGFIYSSANDMTNYIRLLLNNGKIGEQRIVSQNIINEIFKPQILYQIEGHPFYNEFTSYGLGWWLTPKNGHKIIEHSGGLDGMISNLVMVKDLNIGFIILTNESEEYATLLLTGKILEKILSDKTYDIYSMFKAYRDQTLKMKKVEKIQVAQKPIKKPSLDLKKYSGKYGDKMYGDIFINYTKNRHLEISFPHSEILKGSLQHWNLDTFKIQWIDMRIPDGFLTFDFSSKGEISGFSIDQENLMDVDFGELNILKNKN